MSTTSKSRSSGKKIAAKRAKDDLKKIEGIGPAIEKLLNKAGVRTFEELASSKVTFLRKVLSDAGARFQMHDPGTWSKQSGMAAKGNWDKLKKWQDELDGGKKKRRSN